MEFLTDDQVRRIAADYGTPVFVYSEPELERAASELLAFPGVRRVRYAMKALPTRKVLRKVTELGLHIDASSGYEAQRAMAAGIEPARIQLTTQELPLNLSELVRAGVLFNVCSLNQLRIYGELHRIGSGLPTDISVRINPGLGSGHCNMTNVGGPSSSFGIWHKKLPEVIMLAKHYGLKLTRLHTHIGSGSDPQVWVKVADMGLAIVEQLPEVDTFSLGGGLKVGRMPGEKSIDLQACGSAIQQAFQRFTMKTGRQLELEIEPGTYVVAAAGALICTVIDLVDTYPDENGRAFIKVNTGMTENARPALYGAQHWMTVIPGDSCIRGTGTHEYVVAGHCCESGDILTPAPGDPNTVATRLFPRVRLGDRIAIWGVGAYCSGMAMPGYNSFPAAAEVWLDKDGQLELIRQRQTLEQLMQNEL